MIGDLIDLKLNQKVAVFALMALMAGTSASQGYFLLENDNLLISGDFGLGSLNVKGEPLPDSIKGELRFGSGQGLISLSVAKEAEILSFKLAGSFLGRYEGGRGMPAITKDSIIENKSLLVQLSLSSQFKFFDKKYVYITSGPSLHWLSINQYLKTFHSATKESTTFIDYNVNKLRPGLGGVIEFAAPIYNKPGNVVSSFLRVGNEYIISTEGFDKTHVRAGIRAEGAPKRDFDLYFLGEFMSGRDFKYQVIGIGVTAFF